MPDEVLDDGKDELEGDENGSSPAPAPSAGEEAGVEDDELEPESGESSRGRRPRYVDDLYRRQSQTESAIMEIRDNLRRISQAPAAPPPQAATGMNAVEDRLKLTQDPRGYIRQVAAEIFQAEGTESFRRWETERRTKEVEAQAYQEYPELRDQSHPFFLAVRDEYQQLAAEGNQGPRLISMAAEVVSKKRPELRDRVKRAERAKSNGSLERSLASPKVPQGAPRPKQKDEALPEMTDVEKRIARDRYHLNVEDPKVIESLRRDKLMLTKTYSGSPAREEDED